MAFADLLRLKTARMSVVADIIDSLNALAFPAWTDYTPTLSASGSMTYTSTTIGVAKYLKLGNIGLIHIQVSGTTGGTASTDLRFSLPSGWSLSNDSRPSLCRISDGSGQAGEFLASSTLIIARNVAGGNWGLGASRSYRGLVSVILS